MYDEKDGPQRKSVHRWPTVVWRTANRCADETVTEEADHYFTESASHVCDCGQVSPIVCQCHDVASAPPRARVCACDAGALSHRG